MRTYTKRLTNGTARIVRDSYSGQQGWWTIRNEVFARDQGVCQSRTALGKCGAKGVEVHHIIPLKRGGRTERANLITLCKSCHDLRHPGHPKRKS